MQKSLIVDADAHVIETEQTWDYLDPKDRQYRPTLVSVQEERNVEIPRGAINDWHIRKPGYWIVDGQTLMAGRIQSTHYPPGAQFPTDVDARVRHMDELGVDVQVIYPSFFLLSTFRTPEIELALVRSYNRWMAALCHGRNGRLRWVVVVSPKNIEASIEMIVEGKKKGACGVMLRGLEDDAVVDDPQFERIFAAAADHDLPITIHAGVSSPSWNRMQHGRKGNALAIVYPTVAACSAIFRAGIPGKYPRLRCGFIEVTASWLPFIVYRSTQGFGTGKEWTKWRETFLSENRFYVGVEEYEDFDMLLGYGSEDYLMIGSDYGHTDSATILDVHNLFRKRTDLSAPVKQKLAGGNAATFYGLA